MKKILLSLFLVLFLANPLYAKEKSVFPREGQLPFLGLDDTQDPLMTKDGRASDIQNIILNLDGTADKRYGYSVYNASMDTMDANDSFEAITGLYELSKSDGTKTKLAICGEKLFYDNSGTWTHASGMVFTEGQNNQFVWTTALDYAISTNNVDLPFKYNGSGSPTAIDFSDLTNNLTKAKCVIWWKNYLIWGNTVEGGTTHSTRLRWSNVGTIETYSDTDFIDIATQSGQEIEGFGILRDNLIVFLTDSFYMVSLVGGDELFVISKVSEGIGCIAKNSIQNILINNVESLVFLSKNALIYQFDGTRITESSLLIHGTLDTANISRLKYAVSADDQTNFHYYLCLTDTASATTNNLLLDFFYEVGEWSKHTGIEANSMAVANDNSSNPQVYFGNYKSYVYQLNDTNKQNDVYGFHGFFEDKSQIDTSLASGLDILYDDDFSFYDVFLSHFDGTDGSINFIDEAEHTFTVIGNSQIDTSQKQFGTGSILFDGSEDHIYTDASTNFDLIQTGDFTIDFWIKFNTYSRLMNLVYASDETQEQWNIFQNGSTGLNFDCAFSGGPSTGYGEAIQDNDWHHIEVVKNGNIYTLYKDGISIASTTDSDTDTPGSQTLYISSTAASGREFDGWIDELRISKGIARHTADFSVPTSSYDNSSTSNIMHGATLRIISGSGKDEERVIVGSTVSGIVVDSATNATQASEYDIGRIEAFYTTKWYYMSSPILRKNFMDLFLWTTKKSADTLKIYYGGDESSTIESKDLSNYSIDSISGTKIVSRDTVEWSGEELSISKIPLNISGRFIKTKFEETGISETMNLHSYSYVYENLDIY